jgi:O-antigen/teichoic acid export membrane protein
VTIGNGLQRGFASLLVVVLLAIATRSGGLDIAGTIGVAAAIAVIATAVADFGTTLATLRDFALQSPSRRDFVRVLQIKVSLGLLVAGGLSAVAWVVAPSDWAAAVTVACLAIPAAAASSTATSRLITSADGSSLAIGAVFSFAVGCLVAAATAAATSAPWALLLALPAARVVEATLLTMSCVFPPLSPARTQYGWRWLLRSWPLSIHWLLQVAYLRLQVIVPGAVLALVEAGEVANGFTLYAAGALLPGAFAQAAIPAITRAARRSLPRGLRQVARYSLLCVAIVAPASAVLAVFPRQILDAVFAHSSPGLVAYVRWTAAAMLLAGPNALLLSLLVARRHNQLAAAIWAVALLIACGMLAAGSRIWGVAGAGAAIFAAEVLVLALLTGSAWWIARGPALEEPRHRVALPRFAVGLGMVLVPAAAAGAAVPLLGERWAFPDPRSGLLLLLGLPAITFFALRALRYDLLAPASIFALTWTTAIGVAQVPLYPSFSWNGEMWFLVSVASLLWFASAVLVSGKVPRVPRVRGTYLTGRWRAPTALIALLVAVGIAGWTRYYASIGAAPLVSGQIDAIRFSEFDLPTLIGTRFGHVAVILAFFFAGITPSMRQRLFLSALGLIAAMPIVLSGGRLYLVSALASAGIAILIVRGVNWRIAAAVSAGALVLLVASTSVWFTRIEQQAPNPFKLYLENYLVESRPEYLRWTIPVQLAAAGSLHTLSDLVETKAHKDYDKPGPFSLRALDRFVPGGDLEQVTRVHARFNQVTSTYLGEFYADFGLTGAFVAAVVLGAVYGLLYRAMRAGRSLLWVLVYAYAAFWITFSAYLGYWTTHGVWIADLPLLAGVALWVTYAAGKAAPEPVPVPRPLRGRARFISAGAPEP